jgi:hypothetical protein
LDSTRKLGLNLEKAIEWSKITPPSPIKATPTELARNSDIVSNREIASNRDIAQHPATLSDPAILNNPVTLSNSATFSNPSTRSDADEVMLTSPSQSKDVHITVLPPLLIHLKVKPQQ